MLAADGRALHFDGDSAALVRAVLGACVARRSLDALFEEIERLAGAPVDREGPVGEVIAMLRSAGALVETGPLADARGSASRSPEPVATGRRVVLAITGGVAATFAPVMVEELLRRGHHVRCAASKNALRFVSRTSLEALTHERVFGSMWSNDPAAPVNHLELARWAEIVVVHPATATSIRRIANGDCSKLASAVAISTRAPVILVPAMNEAMLSAASIARNVERLIEDGFYVAHAGLGHEVADAPHARRPMVGAPPPPDAVVAIASAILDEHPRPAPSAVQWDQAYATSNPDALPWATRALEPDVAAILDALVAPGARLLDVGTGTGTAAIEAARRGFSVVATDVAPRCGPPRQHARRGQADHLPRRRHHRDPARRAVRRRPRSRLPPRPRRRRPPSLRGSDGEARRPGRRARREGARTKSEPIDRGTRTASIATSSSPSSKASRPSASTTRRSPAPPARAARSSPSSAAQPEVGRRAHLGTLGERTSGERRPNRRCRHGHRIRCAAMRSFPWAPDVDLFVLLAFAP